MQTPNNRPVGPTAYELYLMERGIPFPRIPQTCFHCWGDGLLEYGSDVPCPDCNGSGLDRETL